MEQRDYILREIEKLMKALNAILSRLLGNTDSNYRKTLDEIKQSFSENLKIDFGGVLQRLE